MDSRIDKLSGRISGFERRMLNKHTILIGADAANLSLAEKMKAEGKKFILLTSDKVIADKLREGGYNVFIADPTSNKDLLLYHLDKAKTIIIDLKENSRTFYTLLLARKLSKSAKIIVIVQNKDIEEHVNALRKTLSPAIIRTIVNILALLVTGTMSPYPTVETVSIVKYNAVAGLFIFTLKPSFWLRR